MDDERRCRATAKQTGKRCKRRAAIGGRVCVIHGGASPQARAAAERRQAEAEATALVERLWDPQAAPVTNPVEALQTLAGRLQHSADVLGARLDSSSADLDSATGAAWLRVLRELRQALEGLERLDLTAKHIELEAARAELVTAAVLAGIHALKLTPLDKDLFLETFLRGLGRGPAVTPQSEVSVVRGEVE